MSLFEPPGPDGFFEHPNWGGNLTPEYEDVLPRLQRAAIAGALRRLPREELELALRSKILPMVALPGLKLFAAFGETAMTTARNDGLRLIAEGTAADFIAASRDYAELEPVARAAGAVSAMRAELSSLDEMLADPDMRAMAEEEVIIGSRSQERAEKVAAELHAERGRARTRGM